MCPPGDAPRWSACHQHVTREYASRAVLVAMVAFFLGNSLMFIFGAAGAAALGMADISDVMIAQGLLLPAIVVLGLNIWTTNDNALYASGLGFGSAGRMHRSGRAGKPGWSVSRTVPNRHPHRNRYPRLLKNKNGRKQ